MRQHTHLKVSMHGQPVGELLAVDGQLYFTYHSSWLERGYNLSPLNMDNDGKPQQAKDLQVYSGLHGAFAESLPDAWGMLLMDRFFRSAFDLSPRQITPLDRLAYIADRGMGALEYSPIVERVEEDGYLSLETLYRESQQVMAGGTEATLDALRLAGGSPGGARPKVIVALSEDLEHCTSVYHNAPAGMGQWIVKFRAPGDDAETGAVEYAYSVLAKQAGLEMADCELISTGQGAERERFFATRRFDRLLGGAKVHMMTAAGILYANHQQPELDYADLMALTSTVTKSAGQVERMARLMVFNALFHNHDDHAKNFAFVRGADGWLLAPAYDLTYAPLQSRHTDEHFTSFKGRGLATYQLIKSICAPYKYLDVDRLINDVMGALEAWPALCDDLDISKHMKTTVRRSMDQNRARFE